MKRKLVRGKSGISRIPREDLDAVALETAKELEQAIGSLERTRDLALKFGSVSWYGGPPFAADIRDVAVTTYLLLRVLKEGLAALNEARRARLPSGRADRRPQRKATKKPRRTTN